MTTGVASGATRASCARTATIWGDRPIRSMAE
jgi:hypothetical protein